MANTDLGELIRGDGASFQHTVWTDGTRTTGLDLTGRSVTFTADPDPAAASPALRKSAGAGIVLADQSSPATRGQCSTSLEGADTDALPDWEGPTLIYWGLAVSGDDGQPYTVDWGVFTLRSRRPH